MHPFRTSSLVCSSFLFLGLGSTSRAAETGDALRGKTLFTQSCALCHTTALGPNNQLISGQGPSLVGILGRKAGSVSNFNYTNALSSSGIIWTPAALDHFLTNPAAAVPGTNMPIVVGNETDRRDLVAFLSTLANGSAAVASPGNQEGATAKERGLGVDLNDWHHDAPGLAHRIDLANLPAPYATESAGNGPKTVAQPESAKLSVPPGFTVQPFVTGLSNNRILRLAPNGDIFLAETREGRVRVIRSAPGASAPSENSVFADGLTGPFGIAFYPQGENPQWVYVANNNSVVRFPYKNGDLKASGPAETIVPKLCDSGGGHSTRDIAFSKDGRQLFISVGSGSNVAETMSKKTPSEIQSWEAVHGLGAAWDAETNRAIILVTTPEKGELHTYATGVRNGVGIAVDPVSGDLWVGTNERDGLGDNLVPDYVTHLQSGGYYGWPWYYMGNHEDPRHAGERPDLAGKAIVPDVPLQPHSACLEITFYPINQTGASAFPAEYRGDIFAALHGSWNRSSRTGYKVVRVRRKDGVATGEYDDFLTGFVVNESSVWGRPVGVAVAQDGALLVNDDGSGTLWRIAYTGK